MSALDDAIDAQLEGLRRRDRGMQRRVASAYRVAAKQLRPEMRAVVARIAAANAAGEPVNPEWLRRLAEMRRLEAQLVTSYRAFSDDMVRIVATEAEWAARYGISQSQVLIESQNPVRFVRASREVEQAIMAVTQQQLSPLQAVMGRVASGAVTDFADILTSGVLLGENPNKIAARLAKRLGTDLSKAQLIARTETLRAYRTSSLQTYRANGDVVREWEWHASTDDRTCAVCWAMHGQRVDLQFSRGTHPNCRCAMIPVVRFGPDRELGTELFDRLPADQQERILGPSKFDAYRAGVVSLPQLVEVRQSALWGATRRQRSLVGVLGAEGAKRFYRRR
jgi:SPP1 gp7 family putative phage head morphogenesis protein